jgi:CrcB protein
MTALAYIWVALGGAMGSVARFAINGLISSAVGPGFPWGTIVINFTGSFVIGFFGAITQPEMGTAHRATIIQFVMIGICGGYTTFSSFSLQTFNLLQQRQWLYAAGNVLISVLACMVAVWLGWVLGLMVHSNKGN